MSSGGSVTLAPQPYAAMTIQMVRLAVLVIIGAEQFHFRRTRAAASTLPGFHTAKALRQCDVYSVITIELPPLGLGKASRGDLKLSAIA